MNNAICMRWAVVMLVLCGAVVDVEAAPPPAPPTIWNFLGIPKTLNKTRDVTANRRGNRPGAERTDPLKRIADPANLESENPAIKKAAQIKTDKDSAPQKIKAIKFLATVGCGCYPGVADALLPALDDCTEEVRYEAAVAFCQAAGSPCSTCEKGCCNAKVMQKLDDMAFGQDEKCCHKESSARVRAAAKLALDSCRRKVGSTTPAPTPAESSPADKKEIPLDEPPSAPKEIPVPAAPQSPAPAGAAAPTQAHNNRTSDSVQMIPPPPFDGVPLSMFPAKLGFPDSESPAVTVQPIPVPAYEGRGRPVVVPVTALMEPVMPARTR